MSMMWSGCTCMRSNGDGLQPNEGLHLTPRFAGRR
jgi:hypothetical protein